MDASSYAGRLKAYKEKGRLQLERKKDGDVTIVRHAQLAASWIKASEGVVVHTGAGISTSIGIRDFRSEDGVWSIEENLKRPRSVSSPSSSCSSSSEHNSKDEYTAAQ